ncbi:glycosyltransferase family 4 protein [Thalassospiraceae bacterium LMO-SO8]|nr:glycosyltransferase family 4 protein [Alphaproteobacteria bacterium LMO-S08]WND77613.1 glycosyltransferase family 4 protein [Thalassospiraceae bacterium LMO-SO8]
MTWTTDTLLTAALVFGGVALGTGPLISLLRRFQLLDHPNERSSHHRPTPVGGGLLIVAALVPAWLWLGGAALFPLALAGLGLAAISLVDDFRRVPTGLRFAGHVAAVAWVLSLNPALAGWLPDAVPGPVALIGVGLGWVWFINLFNFMDGIDGITGVECLGIGLGVVAVTALGGAATALAPFGLCLAAAAGAFLIWNWHPAKVFMGDVGSVPLGFLIGWLLLEMAAAGAWAAAVILPAYYLADATLTLARRILRGEAPWRAHRDHFYQQATKGGRSHARVSLLILGLNALLIAAAALVSWAGPWPALALAAGATGGLLALFRYPGGAANP